MTGSEKALRFRAAQAVARAVASGRIIRPSVCSICGRDECRISGHHEDYDRPLDVVWCCDTCHAMVHVRGLEGHRAHVAAARSRRRSLERLARQELAALTSSVTSLSVDQLAAICDIRR